MAARLGFAPFEDGNHFVVVCVFSCVLIGSLCDAVSAFECVTFVFLCPESVRTTWTPNGLICTSELSTLRFRLWALEISTLAFWSISTIIIWHVLDLPLVVLAGHFFPRFNHEISTLGVYFSNSCLCPYSSCCELVFICAHWTSIFHFHVGPTLDVFLPQNSVFNFESEPCALGTSNFPF